MSEWWFNMRTREVEEGRLSPSVDRAGPFSTREEAARAPQIMAERSRKWDEEEREHDR